MTPTRSSAGSAPRTLSQPQAERSAAVKSSPTGPRAARREAVPLDGNAQRSYPNHPGPASPCGWVEKGRPLYQRVRNTSAGLFGQVLRLCDEAGLVRPGVVAIDGTRMAGNASRESTRDFEEIAREILAEARATDEAEDELYGDERGDELPEQLRTREGRAEFFRHARERRAAQTPEAQQPELAPEPAPAEEAGFEFDTEQIVARHQGRQGWTREAHRQLEQHRWENPDPVPRSREDRLVLAGERLEAERDAQVAANRAYEDYRENGRDTQGRKLGRRPSRGSRPRYPRGC